MHKKWKAANNYYDKSLCRDCSLLVSHSNTVLHSSMPEPMKGIVPKETLARYHNVIGYAEAFQNKATNNCLNGRGITKMTTDKTC